MVRRRWHARRRGILLQDASLADGASLVSRKHSPASARVPDRLLHDRMPSRSPKREREECVLYFVSLPTTAKVTTRLPIACAQGFLRATPPARNLMPSRSRRNHHAAPKAPCRTRTQPPGQTLAPPCIVLSARPSEDTSHARHDHLDRPRDVAHQHRLRRPARRPVLRRVPDRKHEVEGRRLRRDSRDARPRRPRGRPDHDRDADEGQGLL